MLYGHLVPTWTFELPKLTTVFYLDIYSAIWTFELPIRMIGSNQWILDLENLYTYALTSPLYMIYSKWRLLCKENNL